MDSRPAINHPRAQPRGAKLANGLVYFIAYDNAGWRATYPVIKIGCTTNLPDRIKTLCTGAPVGFIPAATSPSKDPRALEGFFHRAFSRERLNGEWFKLTHGMIKVIRTYPLIDDRFDDLFDLSHSAPDAKDLEIAALKAQIKELQSKIPAPTNGSHLCNHCKLPIKEDITGFGLCTRCKGTYQDGKFLGYNKRIKLPPVM